MPPEGQSLSCASLFVCTAADFLIDCFTRRSADITSAQQSSPRGKLAAADSRDAIPSATTQHTLTHTDRDTTTITNTNADTDAVSDPAVAISLPSDEFLPMPEEWERDEEYANVEGEDSSAMDFYHAAQGYIRGMAVVEAAWEAR